MIEIKFLNIVLFNVCSAFNIILLVFYFLIHFKAKGGKSCGKV